jgi:peptide/nickel transport system permease protein
MPTFWFALMLIQIFAVQLGWVPPSGVDSWQGWILPAVTGALGFSAFVARQMRSNLLEVIRQDYITTARAKGLSEAKVLYRHGLKNASIPVIMVVGSLFGTAMGGSIITEVIFSIPGLGSYTVSALMNRDFPVIQSSVLLMSVMFAFLLLIIDLLFAVVDPRVRSQYMRRKSKKQPIKEVAVNEQS